MAKKFECYAVKLAGFEIKLGQDQNIHGRFTVTYGKQVRAGLNYVDAAKEFGLCVFHALACDGNLNNEGA